MKRMSVVSMGLLVTGLTDLGCVHRPGGQADAGWITLFEVPTWIIERGREPLMIAVLT
jgi:hypothetical protein